MERTGNKHYFIKVMKGFFYRKHRFKNRLNVFKMAETIFMLIKVRKDKSS